MRRQAIKSAIQSANMRPYLKNATGYRTMIWEAPVRRVIASRNIADNVNYGNSARSEGEYFLKDSSRRRSISMPPNDRLDLLEVKRDLRCIREKSNLSGLRKEWGPHSENDLTMLTKKNSGNESALVRSAKTAFINRSKKIPKESWLGDDRLMVIDNEILKSIKKEKTEKLKMKPEYTDMKIKSFRTDGENKKRVSRKCSPKIIEKPSGNRSIITKKYDTNIRSSPVNKVESSGVDTSQWRSYKNKDRRQPVVQYAKKNNEPMAAHKLSKTEEKANRRLYDGKYGSNMKENSSIHNRGTSSWDQTKGVHAKNTQRMNENNHELPVQFEKRCDLPWANKLKSVNKYGVRNPNLRSVKHSHYEYNDEAYVPNDKYVRSYEHYKGLVKNHFNYNENKGHKTQDQHTQFTQPEAFETKSYSENYQRNTQSFNNTGKSDYTNAEEWPGNHSPKGECKFMKKAHDLSESIKITNRMFDYKNAKYSTERKGISPIYNNQPSEHFVQKYDRIGNSSWNEDLQRKPVQFEQEMQFEQSPPYSDNCRSNNQTDFRDSLEPHRQKFENPMKRKSKTETHTSNQHDYEYEKRERLTQRVKNETNHVKSGQTYGFYEKVSKKS